jgi:DNA-binding response OmpR family regulator
MSHDPAAHEDYGRHLLLSDLRARPWVYGIPIPPAYLEAAREDGSARLRLDLRNRCLELDDGSVVVPSASEWAILLCLARRAGEVVEYLDLVEWIWGTRERRYAMADHRGRTSALNQLRQLTYRVRARQGHTAEDSIIVLVPGVGYRLGGRP